MPEMTKLKYFWYCLLFVNCSLAEYYPFSDIVDEIEHIDDESLNILDNYVDYENDYENYDIEDSFDSANSDQTAMSAVDTTVVDKMLNHPFLMARSGKNRSKSRLVKYKKSFIFRMKKILQRIDHPDFQFTYGQIYYIKKLKHIVESGSFFNAEFLVEVFKTATDVSKDFDSILIKSKSDNPGFRSQINIEVPTKECKSCPRPLLDLRDLDGYGCWCNIYKKILIGRGNPVDDFDKACRDFHRCLKCGIQDNKNDQSCEPRKHLYNVPTNLGELSYNCESSNVNGTSCQSQFCMCHTNLIDDFAKLTILNKMPDAKYSHFNENFNGKETCPSLDKGDGTIVPECCGNYPRRFPYNSAKMQCCPKANKIFDPRHLECCDDKLKLVGNCGEKKTIYD